MASHDGKRRSHQRFLKNLPKQKPGKYLKVILSSVADPDLALRKGGRGRFSVAWTAGFSSFCDSFFFFTQNKEGRSGLGPQGLIPQIRHCSCKSRFNCCISVILGRVVRKGVDFNPGLKVNLGFNFSYRRACTGAKVLLGFISV